MIDNLSHHISTLLRRNDCVIVPGLGAFVATRREAVVSANAMLPPSRILSFNPAMTHDDGLLADSISRRLHISFTQAREKVAAEVALLQRRLKSDGAVQLSNIGILNRRSGGRLEFIEETPWLTLPQINIVKAAPALEITPAPEADQAVAIVRVPLRLRWLRVAAAIAILSIISFAISTPIDLDTAQHASLSAPAFTAPEQPVYEPLPEPVNMQLNLAVAPPDGIFSISKPTQETPQPYIIVVGSLPSQSKAEAFIAETGISGLNIYHSGDKYRVYAAQGATPEAARAAAESISGFASQFPDAWVCRR